MRPLRLLGVDGLMVTARFLRRRLTAPETLPPWASPSPGAPPGLPRGPLADIMAALDPCHEAAAMSAPLTLVIGTRRYSSWSLRPFLALSAAGAAFEVVEIALRQTDTKANIRAWSPSGKVPLLVHGDVKVWDSLAICEYVAELFPAAGLWPEDREARALARAVAAEMHSGFPTLRHACPLDLGAAPAPPADLAPAVAAELAAEIGRVQGLWADCRRRFGADGPFLFGRFTIADAMWAPVVTRVTTHALPRDAVAAAYCDAVWALPALQAWRTAPCAPA